MNSSYRLAVCSQASSSLKLFLLALITFLHRGAKSLSMHQLTIRLSTHQGQYAQTFHKKQATVKGQS